MPDEKRFSPFSNGSQYMDWDAANCGTCSKVTEDKNGDPDCEIFHALSLGCISDGTVSADIARRMGCDDDESNEKGGRVFSYVWPCPEHKPPFKNVDQKTNKVIPPNITVVIGCDKEKE